MKNKPQIKADLPPPNKPPGRSVAAGTGGDDETRKRREEIRIALPPKPILVKK